MKRQELSIYEDESAREWSKDKLSRLKEKAKQLQFFQTEEEVKKEFMALHLISKNRILGAR